MSLFADAIQRGLRSEQPLASDVVIGALYYVTDEQVTERSSGTAWESYSDTGTVVGPVDPPMLPDGLLSGGEVVWVGNLDFIVSAATYRLGGIVYSSPQTPITLTVADADDDRIDIIVVNSSSLAVAIPGTPAPSPAAPDVDPLTQIALTFVYVPEDATEPANITVEDMYLENTEWTSATNAAGHITLASTSNPFAGTKDIEATAAVANDNITLTKPAAATEDLADWNSLVLNLRFKAAWPNAKQLNLVWLNGASTTGTTVVVKNGLFGLSQANTTTYQQVVIPLSAFNVPTVVTKLQITVTGGGAAIGFYLDNIYLHAGVTEFTLPTGIMLFKGTWNSAVAYATDDVVISGGVAYVAVAPSTNSTPPSANWQSLGGVSDGDKGSITVSSSGTVWTLDNGVVTEAKQTLADNTTGNVSTSAHGYAPKLTAPSAGIRNILKIDNGETALTSAALFDTTNPANLGSAGPGTSLIAARRDHIHNLPTIDSDDVTYVPATLADWNSSADPGDVEQALDQLAERVTDIVASGTYSDEQAQDAVGTILTDTATIDFTYTDATPTIEASVKSASITEAMQVLADNTTNNSSTSNHGYLKKLSNSATDYMDGTGNWSTPAGGGGGSSNSAEELYEFDDFITGETTQDRHKFIYITGATTTIQVSEANHPGILQISTTGANSLNLNASVGTIFLPVDNFTMTFVVRPNGTANQDCWVGGRSSIESPATVNNGIWVESLAADTNWFLVTRSSDTQTRTDTGVACSSATWYKIVIRRVNGSTIGATVNAGSEVTTSSNVPTAGMQFFIQMGATSGTQTFDIDFWSIADSVTRF